MDASKTLPRYNLGAVTLDTGINAETLRAWERRYNLPQPARSAGGQRLYSQRDLEIVKWLIEQQKAGLRISQAAELWHNQVAQGLDPIKPVKQVVIQPAIPSVNGGNLAEYKSQWVSACLSFNEARAEQVVMEAFSVYPPETVCFKVLFAGLSEIGQSWYEGNASVQQEHFASALVTRRLNALIAGTPPSIRSERIVIAAPTNEDHTLPSLLITFLLRRRGWDVVYLGSDMPLEDFRATIEELGPGLVILTAQTLITAAKLLDLANDLADLPTTLAFGGLVFNRIPLLHNHIPGYFLGEDLKDAVPNIEALLNNLPKRRALPLREPSPLLERFRAMLPVIESRVNERFGPHPGLQMAPSQYLSRYILAALKLGNISFLSIDILWVRGLLSNNIVPNHLLQTFLQIYYQSVDEVLGSHAAPVLDWLQSEIDRVNS